MPLPALLQPKQRVQLTVDNTAGKECPRNRKQEFLFIGSDLR